jgi:hypothetical protein
MSVGVGYDSYKAACDRTGWDSKGAPSMQIPVLVEPIDGRGFRARGGEPFALSAEGATREEALRNLGAQLEAKLREGAQIVPLDVTLQPHPLAEFAGVFKGDPWISEWKEAMAEYRRKVDEEPDLP